MTRPKRPRPSGPARGPRDAQKPSSGGRPGRPGAQASGRPSGGDAPSRPGPNRVGPNKTVRRGPPKARPELDVPPPDAVFRDRDGEKHGFPESNLKRVAARILTERKKLWRHRAFPFPLYTDKGNEQNLTFDFYVYDNQDAVIRVILVVARDTPELWDRVGRFKRQYPMYPYELWTPEKLAALQRPRAQLGF